MAVGLLLIGMTVAARNPDGPRPRSDVADERHARLDPIWEEVRRIVAEFHALLPRDRAEAVGAAYARYSSRFQDSVADQVRAVFADAVREGVFIPLDHVFLDLAVRGVKNDRPGLNALRAASTGRPPGSDSSSPRTGCSARRTGPCSSSRSRSSRRASGRCS